MPDSMIPNVVGYPTNILGQKTEQNNECFIGNDAILKRGHVKLHYPVNDGIVHNWYEFINKKINKK